MSHKIAVYFAVKIKRKIKDPQILPKIVLNKLIDLKFINLKF